MSGQVSRGSAGEYQADERAGVARLSWRVSMSLSKLWVLFSFVLSFHFFPLASWLFPFLFFSHPSVSVGLLPVSSPLEGPPAACVQGQRLGLQMGWEPPPPRASDLGKGLLKNNNKRGKK